MSVGGVGSGRELLVGRGGRHRDCGHADLFHLRPLVLLGGSSDTEGDVENPVLVLQWF